MLSLSHKGFEDNCWSVKVESCGCTVLRSYDSRFLRWGSIVFLLGDLPALHRTQPSSPTNHALSACNDFWLKHIPRLEKPLQLIFLSFFYITAFSVHPPSYLLFFFSLSLNLKSKICLNWLQRALGGIVSTVMRVLIGPEAQAANRPLLVCRDPLLAR